MYLILFHLYLSNSVNRSKFFFAEIIIKFEIYMMILSCHNQQTIERGGWGKLEYKIKRKVSIKKDLKLVL